MTVIYLYCFVAMLTITINICAKDLKISQFLSDCSQEPTESKTNCAVVKTSYVMWLLKFKSSKRATYCLLSFLKSTTKIDTKQNRQFLVLLYSIFKANKSNKCAKMALKLASKSYKNKVEISEKWAFLGPFQIGKPEIDGCPIEENAIDRRWDTKRKYYTELLESGIVKWSSVLTDQNGAVELSPQLNWNNLVMSLQSAAVTEWQGVLMNEFCVFSENTVVQIQCLGVNVFYVDETLINGDIYHRSEYWYPMQLNIGVHVIKVPVRFAGIGVIKCLIKTNRQSAGVVFHGGKALLPDLVDGNVFSHFMSIPVTNMDPRKKYIIDELSVVSEDFEGKQITVEVLNEVPLFEGQVSQVKLLLKLGDGNDHPLKCVKSAYNLKLQIRIGNGEEQVKLSLRCRSSKESFVFTFLDHDGSVQHAAAVQPLKPCVQNACPVLIALHGTGVSASNQADSYKRMINGKFVYGVEKLWLLAPTRHGAHNWEGPGELTSMTALQRLGELTKEASAWLGQPANSEMVIFAGHSMGGHGAWQLSTHHPDKALAVISAAGWLSKEEYGNSNIFYRHDISNSHVDPATKFIQESCVVENQADKHASNLKGVPVMIRVGSSDRTVHPYYGRRMLRLLNENGVEVNYKEFPGKEHWWWDTKTENDGGVSNDDAVRKFLSSVTDALEATAKAAHECNVEDGCSTQVHKKYSSNKSQRTVGKFMYVVYNPASFSGGRGVKIIEQEKPLRRSIYHMQIDQNHVVINTTNMQRILVYEPPIEPIYWKSKEISIDGSHLSGYNADELPWLFCKQGGIWTRCSSSNSSSVRSYLHYGPARRIAEKSFVIIACRHDDKETNRPIVNTAVFLSNLFHLTSDAHVPVVVSRDLSEKVVIGKNIIILGNEKCVEELPVRKLIRVSDRSLEIGNCSLRGENLSAMYLTTFQRNLALVLTSSHVASITKDLVKLTFPTIVPMTRSPFSNLLPDYVALSAEVNSKGPGGFLCSGFWDNQWKYDSMLSSCVC